MIHAKKIMLTLVLATGAGITAFAQTNGSNSPYSRYGFGLLSDRGQGFNKGMSGLSYGMSNGQELNYKNPASYASIDSLSFLFDVGLNLQKANIQQGSNKINANNAALDYLTLGFRATKDLGISLGIMPFSTIGYNISQKSSFNLEEGTTQTHMYSGDGGLHEVFGGIGWRPVNPLSIGINAGLLWGDMTHTVIASFSDAAIASRRRQYDSHIRTYNINIGAQYNQVINKKNSMTLGITYTLGHDIKSDALYYDQKIKSGNITSGDTLTAPKAFQLPHTLGVGFTWCYKDRLRAGMDYTYQKWSDVKSPKVHQMPNGTQEYRSETGEFTDMHKITMGAEFQPNPNGLHWYQLIRYRAGFSFTSPYAKIDGKDGPRSYTASLGLGLPIINLYNRRSIVNISAQYERVEPQFAGMIKENYFRICIGLSFNERWFMKWKVE